MITWGGAAVTALLLALIVIRLREARPVQSVSRYEEMRRRVGDRVGPDAIGVLPPVVPSQSLDAHIWARVSRRSNAAEVYLRCRLPLEDAARIAQDARERSASVKSPKVGPDFYQGPGFDSLLQRSDANHGPSESMQPFVLHHRSLSAGVDETWAGVLVDESTGTVLWWARRWCVPYN